jgi:glutathione S-transferase
MITIHGVSLSPFARKVLFGLEYKEIQYEQVPVFPGDDSEAFSAISPLKKIPVIEDDGFTVPDSSIILR